MATKMSIRKLKIKQRARTWVNVSSLNSSCHQNVSIFLCFASNRLNHRFNCWW